MTEQIKVLCTKDVVMSKGSRNAGEIAFVEGKVYEGERWSDSDMSFIDELGNNHSISGGFFDEHFEELRKEPSHAVKLLLTEKKFTEDIINRRRKDIESYKKELSLFEEDLVHNLERLEDINKALEILQ